MANTTLPGYESIWGNKKVTVIDRTGPVAYNNTGTYATSGDVLTAAELGWGGIDVVIPSQSSDGLNEIIVSFTVVGGGSGSVALHWFVTASGAEVANAVNLSTKTIRLLVIGF